MRLYHFNQGYLFLDTKVGLYHFNKDVLHFGYFILDTESGSAL
jgi:hypothetical protein